MNFRAEVVVMLLMEEAVGGLREGGSRLKKMGEEGEMMK